MEIDVKNTQIHLFIWKQILLDIDLLNTNGKGETLA